LEGCFGVNDCMGSKRNLQYDAVIGVGGLGSRAVSIGISGKINWIGIGPHKTFVHGKRGPEVRFDHFKSYGKIGPPLSKYAPTLARWLYTRKARFVIVDCSDREYSEVCQIVASALSAGPSGRPKITPVNERNQRKCQCIKKPVD
jgi:hypothetical protein